MNDSNKSPATLAELDEFLARWGSDRTRWPAHARLAVSSLVAKDEEARRLLAEAEALDRLIALAPGTKGDVTRLADRITALAFAEEQETPRSKPVEVPRAYRRRPQTFDWRSAAVLAASLVIGAFAGFSGAPNLGLTPTTTAASEQDASDPGQIALGQDGTSLLEEDLL